MALDNGRSLLIPEQCQCCFKLIDTDDISEDQVKAEVCRLHVSLDDIREETSESACCPVDTNCQHVVLSGRDLIAHRKRDESQRDEES